MRVLHPRQRVNPDPDEDTIRTEMASNICRCTGYVKIIEAVQFAVEEIKANAKSKREAA